MKGLQHFFSQSKEISTMIKGIEQGLREQLVAGLSGAARALLAASVYKETGKTQLLVTHNLLQAQKLYDDLSELLSEDEISLYPVNELIASEIAVASPELRGQRIEVLNNLVNQKKGVVITPISGLRRILPPPNLWKKAQLELKTGEDLNVEEGLNLFVSMGYERKDMVSAPGEFSLRGGIIDIYPLTEEMPIRIELFDTEIDSIRWFNSEDQRSLHMIESIVIGPATEVLLTQTEYANGISKLEKGLAQTLKKFTDSKMKEILSEQVSGEIEQLKEGHSFQGIFKYMSLFYDTPTSLLDYLPRDSVLLFDEMSRIQEMSSHLEKEEAEWQTQLLGHGEIIRDVQLSHSLTKILQESKYPHIYLSLFLRHVPHTNPQNILNINCKPMQSFHGQMDLLKGEIERWNKSGYTIVFLAGTKERMDRLENVLSDYGMDTVINETSESLLLHKSQIIQGEISAGFELPIQKIAVLSEEELFKKKVQRPKRRQKLSNAERIKSYSELKVGDYVVHVNHGIGKYLGIETLEMNGIHKDYLNLQYSGNDKLFVPVDQIDQVQKYVGSEGKEPKVYKLGGSEWKKVKSKVQSSVQDIADDLIKLYAEREASKGFAFSKDSMEQQEFEGVFPYKETEDQLRSIHEIKEDMEKERPMDRLLCGDVGYGKTEVAIRAAFKAILDGKQVAILVPTTILAQQHYETIQERFQDHAINIGLLSRFRTRKQQTDTLKGLKNGTVDLVIGTHRLLSKDIVFKDLGLLIVDEEQRFGVTHKEKIKQMKANVDVLTLTATPIPRTLHMSMLGVRDLSVIETPPENRFPVQTYVVEYSPGLIRDSIERELARGGQVFFLYNRVEDIERKAEEISMLVPDARVTYAHGKMKENELESVMLDFLDGQFDVLVSTTIIETGVDIPNVNTLIVNNADKMGLSQLYQLRGRVGRSNRVAYAYFTYQRDKVLTEVAEKRLQAIKEFTELGSGFKIAMRDLTIRGAGNLLGSQQHGFIDSVGFDLYSQMLKDAIEEKRGKPEERKRVNVEIDMEIDAYIPGQYIEDGRQKIDMYKRFRGVDTLNELDDLQEEMVDRFGEYPDEVGYLFGLTRLKVLAISEGIRLIKQEKDEVTMLMDEQDSQKIDGAKLFEMVQSIKQKIRLGTEGKQLKMVLNIKNVKVLEQLETLEKLLTNLSECKRVETKV